jgi:DNA-binding transcriptional LysR family regulator
MNSHDNEDELISGGETWRLRMDWDLCRVFLAVAEAGNLTGAARRLRSSHPTVGRKIAALEAQLNTRLLARTTDGLALTVQGHKFREQVEAMAVAARRAEAVASGKGQQARGIVRLSIGATLAAYWLMPHMAEFQREHPGIEAEFITHPFPVSVMRRQADIVLRVSSSGGENLVGRKIGRLAVGLYASRDYAARRSLPERQEDWKEHSVIGFADNASNTELARWSDRITRLASIGMRCSSQADMLAAARAGVGICALSCLVANRHPDLVRVAPHRLISITDMWLLAHPDLVDLPAVRAVLKFVTARGKVDAALLRGSVAGPT